MGTLVKVIWNGRSIATRELKRNNIFGLESCRFTRLYGQIGEDNEKPDHLAIMPTLESGIHAAIDLIRAAYLVGGFFVPFLLGNRWSGDLTKKYGKSLAQIMRVSPFLPLPFASYGDSLLRAMAIMENGDPCRSIPAGYFGQFINEEY